MQIKLYTENPKDTTKKLLELINESGKAAGHKINIKKSVVFLYTNNKIAETEIKKRIPFTTVSRLPDFRIQESKQHSSGRKT